MMYKRVLEAGVSEMVRKQIYIHKRQQALLEQLARARGVSQAAIIRRAIEREAVGSAPQSVPPDRAAWEEVLDAVVTRKALGFSGAAYRWNRQDAYQEREGRYNQPRVPDSR